MVFELQDEETGLYYYGARYLDAKYSRWLSADPAVGEYIPMAPVDDEAKKHNQQLPGQGGVFNVVNFQLYHYAGNNPVKYTDPDGRYCISYYYNSNYKRYCYGMFTFHDRSKIESWVYYHIYRGVASWIPFGGYLTNLNQIGENAINKVLGKNYRLIYNSDSASVDLFGIALDTITTFVPAAKTGKFLDYVSKYFSLKGSYDAIKVSRKDKIISDFMDSQDSDLFYGILYKDDAIIVGAAYAKAALDYNSYGLGKKGISKSDFGKAVRQYLWTHEKNDIFKSVYGNQYF
nr:RHS repeat-associated core domain-containing protein [Treponema socranskii]